MTKPIITLDMKKNRIRLHKSTLKGLNDPEYIYILVNPHTKKIAVCKAGESDKDAIKIMGREAYCDVYSTELMYQISSLNENITSNVSYRLYGTEKNGFAEFDIRIFEILNQTGGSHE